MWSPSLDTRFNGDEDKQKKTSQSRWAERAEQTNTLSETEAAIFSLPAGVGLSLATASFHFFSCCQNIYSPSQSGTFSSFFSGLQVAYHHYLSLSQA